MLLYTRAALTKIVADLKRITFIYNIISPVITLAYLIYAAISGIGLIYINIALAALTAAQLIAYLTIRKNKKALRQSKHIINRMKIATKAFSLGVAVYGIYIANEKTTVITIVFAAVNILTWLIQLALELISSYAEAQIELIIEGIKADFDSVKDSISKPIRTAGEMIKKAVTGKDGELCEKEEKPSRARLFLEKRIARMKEQKRIENEKEKLKLLEEQVKEQKSLIKNGGTRSEE